MLNAVLIGFGYWGTNLAHTIESSSKFNLYGICECKDKARDKAKDIYKNAKYFANIKDMLKDKNIDCVFVATPPHSHYEIARSCLENGIHTFVEKPLATTLEDAKRLYEFAYTQKVTLYCDHIFLHSPSVKYLKEHLYELGDIIYINSRRLNLGLFQYEIDVLWDLAIHDLSIVEYLVGLESTNFSVSNTKFKSHPQVAKSNIALNLDNNIKVNIDVSWLSPIKVREMVIVGENKSAIYDERLSDKLQIYDSGVLINPSTPYIVDYKIGEISLPKIDKTLPLASSILYFGEMIDLVKKGDFTSFDVSKSGVLNVVKMLERLNKKYEIKQKNS